MKRLVCLVLCLLCIQYARAELIISEVYFDDTDEWIEIYNTGPDDFQGTLLLSGAKSTQISLTNINIPANQNIVVGDTMAMIIDKTNIMQSGLALNIADSSPMAIKILSGSDLLDTFQSDTTTMATAKQTNASLHKTIEDKVVHITDTLHSTNSISGFPSNPATVFQTLQTQQESTPDIIISEVYFEGANERFELTNIGIQDFSGTLTIQGVSNTPYIIQVLIPAGASHVWADTLDPFIDTDNIQQSTQALVLPDDGNIDAILLHNQTIIDTFNVQEDIVYPYINSNNSFEKVLYNGQYVITIATGDRIFNILDPFIANPGMVFTVQEEVVDIQEEEDIPPDDDLPTHCTTLGDILSISEVFFGSGNYAPYIELYATQNINENITIQGSNLVENIVQNISLHQGDRFVITFNKNGYIDSPYVVDNQKLSFSSEAGLLTIFGQNGQVLDIVDIRPQQGQKSYYFSTQESCQRVFNTANVFTPGFDEKLLQYFPSGITQIIHVGGGGGGGSCTTQTDDNIPSETNLPQTGTNYNVTGDSIDILDIVYDPIGSDTDRETITLHSLLPWDISLHTYRLGLSSRSGYIVLSGVLYAGQTQTFTGNYRFPNTTACVTLYSGTVQALDTYCYAATTNTGTIIASGTVYDTGFDIDITHIIYDPEGSDTNRETITFFISGSHDIQFSQDFYVLIGSRKYWLSSYTGNYSGSITLTGNFQFPNTAKTCVSLGRDTYIFDTYCYDPSYEEPIRPADIKIQLILFDPPGSDTNNESITLKLISGDNIILNEYKLSINGRNATLSGMLYSGSAQTFIGNYRFPNTSACVSLKLEDYVVDTLCYENILDETDQNDDNENENYYREISIHIKNIVYDPPGSDTNNESITLEVQGGPIDLSDDFYLLIGTRKRYLRVFGSIDGIEELVGSFSFPNTKQTCVSLHRKDIVYDTYCYSPIADPQQTVFVPDFDMSIVSVLPNPLGNDTDSEQITLLLSGSYPVSLDNTYTLRINDRKTKIIGLLIPGEPTTFMGNYRFPNDTACVSLERDTHVFDTFCYDKHQEGQLVQKSQGTLEYISTIDLRILFDATLQRQGDSMCLVYLDATITCKKSPTKASTKTTNELRLYKNYVNILHDHLLNQWSILYYNSPLYQYKTIFDQAKQDIAQGKISIIIGSQKISVYDIAQRLALQYDSSLVQSTQSFVYQHILGPKAHEHFKELKNTLFQQFNSS